MQAAFAGTTAMAVEADVRVGGRAVFAGSTEAQVAGLLAVNASATFVGDTLLTARGRLNNEPNIFADPASVLMEGATALDLGVRLGLFGTAQLAGATALSVSAVLVKPQEIGFTIFLDILGSVVAGAGTIRRYAARMLADGEELPVRNVTESAPRNALGISLNVTLAKPDASLVSASAGLTLEIGVWDGAAFGWLPILAGGKLAGLEARYANADRRPADVVSFSTLDPLGNRWTFAPTAPEIVYDPDRVDAPAPPDAQSAIRDDEGGLIEQVATPVYGLSLKEVLRRAYVEGCGFGEVITNVPDFPVSSVSFTLEGGYHNSVLPLLSLFEPLYFVDGNSLWIVDTDAPLPAGAAPIVLTGAEVQSLDDTLPARQPVTGIIVDQKEDARAGGDYFTERIEQETTEAGSFGAAGYTQTTTTRRVREYRNLDAPETVVRGEVVSTETETLDWMFEVVGRETQTDSFDGLGRKSGHARTIEARVPDLADDGALTLQTVTEERYSVFYRPSVTPGVDEIARTTTELFGAVLIDEDKLYLGKPYELPYLDAHHSGYIDPDGNQTVEFRAIRTVEEIYVREGASVEVRRRVTSHLNGGSTETTTSQTRAGSTAVSRRAQKIVRRMLTLEGAEAQTGRIVPSFSGGDLPGDLTIELGRRKLARLNDPPRQVTARLPYLDFRIRRGSIVELWGRAGTLLGTFLVEGYTRTLTALDSDAQQFSMSLVAHQLGGPA